MVGPRPAGLLASGLTVRELGGEHIIEMPNDKYFEISLEMKVQSPGGSM